MGTKIEFKLSGEAKGIHVPEIVLFGNDAMTIGEVSLSKTGQIGGLHVRSVDDIATLITEAPSFPGDVKDPTQLEPRVLTRSDNQAVFPYTHWHFGEKFEGEIVITQFPSRRK